jgi:hypothetical protein
MLKEKGTRIHAFTLYVVGEGIEKKTGDFRCRRSRRRSRRPRAPEGHFTRRG